MDEPSTPDLQAQAGMSQQDDATGTSGWELVADAVVTWGLDGCIAGWNRAAERLLGYSSRETLGRPPGFLRPEDQAIPAGEQLAGWLAEHEGGCSERKLYHRDGYELVCESSFAALRGDDGHPQVVIEVMRDVTERKAFERQLAARQEAAEAASFAKSRFLWTMSHELRTPLNAVLGFAQLLEKMEPGLSEQQLDFLAHIIRGGEHLRKLVSDMLDFSKIEAGELRLANDDIDCDKLCEECLSLIEADAAERDINASSTVNCNRFISGDYTRVKQVLLNLLGNGVKYNRDGGRLQVLVSELVSGQVRIEVIDSGEGIPEDMLEAIFEPLSRVGRTDRSVEGSGLGLAIASSLVQLMGGRIGVESTLGKGSMFWFELPGVPKLAPVFS